ncbi:MAG: PaaI family thioesterase [Treponema sp.]|nr:PaaI family thioesterase [Treponema sp.]
MTLEEVKKFFANDKYATETTGIEILEAGGGKSKIHLALDERHKNALGFVMGAVYFTMADFAFAVASNSDETNAYHAVTLSSTINMVNSAKSDELFAEALPIKDGHSTCFYQIDIYEIFDDKKRPVATVLTAGYKVGK